MGHRNRRKQNQKTMDPTHRRLPGRRPFAGAMRIVRAAAGVMLHEQTRGVYPEAVRAWQGRKGAAMGSAMAQACEEDHFAAAGDPRRQRKTTPTGLCPRTPGEACGDVLTRTGGVAPGAWTSPMMCRERTTRTKGSLVQSV